MSYGITDSGFVRKPFAQIIAEKIERAKIYLGASIDLRPTSSIYKLAQLNALEEANLWELAEQFWYSMWATTAEGASLELIGELFGLEPQDPTKSIGTVTFTGTNYSLIPLGTIVTTYELADGIVRFKTTVSKYIGQIDDEQITEAAQGAGPTYTLAYDPADPPLYVLWWDDSANGGNGAFVTLTQGTVPDPGEYVLGPGANEITINTVGGAGLDTDDFLRITYIDSAATSVDVAIECLDFGAIGRVPAESIVNIETPVSGITSVLNDEATTGGTDTEADNTFRQRIKEKPKQRKSVEDIQAEVENVDGIRSAIVQEGTVRETFAGTGGGISTVTVEYIPEDPVSNVRWWDNSETRWFELEEAVAPLGPYQYEVDYLTGDIDLGSPLLTDDILEVAYVNADIGSSRFLVLVDPIVSPLTSEVEDDVRAAVNLARPPSIAFTIVEIDKIGILVDVDVDIEAGYNIDTVGENVNKFVRIYIEGPASDEEADESEYTGLGVGGLIVRNELIKIVMEQDGVTELADLIVHVEDEPIEVDGVLGNDIAIATVDDVYPYGVTAKIYSERGKTGTEYDEGVDWSIAGNHITWLIVPPDAIVYINYQSVTGNAQIQETQAPEHRGGDVT